MYGGCKERQQDFVCGSQPDRLNQCRIEGDLYPESVGDRTPLFRVPRDRFERNVTEIGDLCSDRQRRDAHPNARAVWLQCDNRLGAELGRSVPRRLKYQGQ
jgi:hypothetical protein